MFQDTELPKGVKSDANLSMVPEKHSLMDVEQLEKDGKQAFDTLINYMTSESISRFEQVLHKHRRYRLTRSSRLFSSAART